MNDNTKTVYALARIYGYILDLDAIMKENGFNIDKLLSSRTAKYAVNMCIHQIGEQAKTIRETNKELYDDPELVLHQVKGIRDKIAHTYDNIDYSVIKYVLVTYRPFIKSVIEALVETEVLENPYCLFDREAKPIDLEILNSIKRQLKHQSDKDHDEEPAVGGEGKGEFAKYVADPSAIGKIEPGENGPNLPKNRD